MAGKQSSKSILKAINKEAEGLADIILQEIPTDPNNPLASKNKIRHEILENMGAEEYRLRIPKAYKAIQNDLKSHLTQVQLEALHKEFDKALDKLVFLTEEKVTSFNELLEKMDTVPDSFQKILGLSDGTIEHCYQSGCRYFESHHYKEASHIFFLLTVLNPYRFNVWISQGLSEKKAHHYDKALRAFAMASMVDPKAILPHIHSIECYLELKDKHNAKDAIEYALRMIREHPSKDMKQYEIYINNLKTKHFKK